MVRMLVRAKVGLLVDHPSCRAVVVTQHVCHQALAAWPWQAGATHPMPQFIVETE